jgi:hypothetical protein
MQISQSKAELAEWTIWCDTIASYKNTVVDAERLLSGIEIALVDWIGCTKTTRRISHHHSDAFGHLHPCRFQMLRLVRVALDYGSRASLSALCGVC